MFWKTGGTERMIMKKHLSHFTPWAAAALACFALAGCLTDNSSTGARSATDGGNVVFAQEVKNMASVLDGGSLAKAAHRDSMEDSDNVEHSVTRLHFDSTCQCFVRGAEFSGPHGLDFGRTRADSLWLYVAGQAIVDSFVPRQADSIIHVRHVTRIDGQSGRSLDFTAKTTLVKRATDSGTVFIWTGTVTGTLNGVAVSGSTFSLVRTFTTGSGFGVPRGNLLLKRGLREVSLQLHEDGTADCTVRRGGKVERTTHIDNDDNET
jgi:hypothetical protein